MTTKIRKILYPTFLILGLYLMAIQVNIFRLTIIDPLILVGIVLFIGIATFILDFNNYEKTYESESSWVYLYASMIYICGCGFIACFIFMVSNYYLADKSITKKSFEIVEQSSISAGEYKAERHPTFRINYDGKIKELVFNHEYDKNMSDYEFVELDIKKGFWGYDVIDSKILK